MASSQSPGGGSRKDFDEMSLEKMWIGVWAISLVVIGTIVFFATREYDHSRSLVYVGPDACGECHQAQLDSWKETRMARSFEALLPGKYAEAKKRAGLKPDTDYSDDPACLPCHTTGYGLVGGFVSFEETPHMAGVTCEACHGPGGRYAGTVMDIRDPSFGTQEAVAAGLVYPPTKRVCVSCHNEDSPFVSEDYEFDYSQRVEAGTHAHFKLKYNHGDRPRIGREATAEETDDEPGEPDGAAEGEGEGEGEQAPAQ